jgi:propanol-preferring alcohol dehydrogenase
LKAVRFYKANEPLRVEEITVPEAGPKEVLVKIRSAGICHTELHFLEGMLAPWKGTLPLTLGHEIAGEVFKIGKGVRGFRKGDRVVVYNGVSCGKCTFCKTGKENLCVNLDQLGFTLDGGYAEYVKTPANTLVKLPRKVSFESGAVLTCGAGSTYHALHDIAGLRRGEILMINGFGGLGTIALQIAKSFGARVIAVDVASDKLREAENLGAMATINAMESNVGEKVKEYTKGAGVDVVLELVGREKTIQSALESLGKTGRMVIVGYTNEQFKAAPFNLVVNEWRIFGSVAYTKRDLKAVVELAQKGRLSPLISARVGLAEIPETLQRLKRGEIMGRAVAVMP